MILAACVYNRHELDTVRDLRDLGLRAYVPCETVERLIMGRKRKFRRPTFPGYAFIELEPARLAEVRSLASVYGFVGVAGSDGVRRPAEIPQAELRAIFLAELFGEFDMTRKAENWKPGLGETVRVKASMWRGYIGKVLRMSKKEAWIEPAKGGELRVALDELERAA